ncbi:MAG: tripartite tricarboxylate transporter substrate binding protein [Acetobacteraceae bacterium]|nr:tripartite tricarboxylate transporter substrate binding protein [Acetobacteraceae bacterium]
MDRRSRGAPSTLCGKAPTRRALLLGAAAAVAAPGPDASAQPAGSPATWPDRPIRIIIPFAPGGPTDIVGRPLADLVSAALGVPVVVENRAGAGGAIGTEAVARARPDGHTLLLTTGSHISNSALNPALPYDPIRDFAPVTQTSQSYGMLLVARPNLPARDLRGFLEMARARPPGSFTYAHAGLGNITHICAAMLESEAGIQLLAVPFRGTGPAFTELMAGRIDVGFASLTAVLAHVREGRLKPLAFTSAARVQALPDTPTFAELGLPALDIHGWQGIWAPAGTPPAVVERIAAAARDALRGPLLTRIIEDSASFVVASTPAEFAAFQERDMAVQRGYVQRLGLKPE